MAAKKPQIEIYQIQKGEFGWRLRARNGQIIATGHETYTRKGSLINTLEKIIPTFKDAVIEDLTLKKS